MPDPTPDPILLLVRDLMFSSKITAEARAANLPFKVIRDPAHLSPDTPGRKLLVDLNLEGAPEPAAAWKRATGKEVVAFVSHVDTPRIEHARSLGIETVLPRSRFSQSIAAILNA